MNVGECPNSVALSFSVWEDYFELTVFEERWNEVPFLVAGVAENDGAVRRLFRGRREEGRR